MIRRRKTVKLLIACFVAFFFFFEFFSNGTPSGKVVPWKTPVQQNATFFKFKDKPLYIYSAYADVRFGHMVRMIGMARRDNNGNMFCFISRSDGTFQTLPTSIEYLPEGHNMKYDAIYVLCKSHRPLTNDDMVGLSDHHSKPDFLLPVKVIPSVPSSSEQGMTVCYPPLHGNFDDVEQFVENIEMNLILGFRQFFVYVHKVGPRVRKAIASYVEEGIVHEVSWKAFPLASGRQYPVPESYMIHYMGQMVAINDCLYRAMNSPFRVVAFHDFDELIIPRVGRSLSDTVAKEMGPYVSGLSVRCAMFSMQLADDKDALVELLLKNDPRLRTQLKTKRLQHLHPHRDRSKMLVAADEVITMGIHFVWNFREGRAVHLDADVALLHHYRNAGNTTSVVDRTAWKYAQDLIENVKRRLQLLTLEENSPKQT